MNFSLPGVDTFRSWIRHTLLQALSSLVSLSRINGELDPVEFLLFVAMLHPIVNMQTHMKLVK